MAVVKTKAGDFGLFGPIRLRLCKHFREERQHESRRVLSFEHRIACVFKPELGAEVSDRFRLVSALRQTHEKSHDAWSKHTEIPGPLPEGWHRRIVSGVKGERREYGGAPGHAELSARQWTGGRRGMCDQKIGAVDCFQ